MAMPAFPACRRVAPASEVDAPPMPAPASLPTLLESLHIGGGAGDVGEPTETAKRVPIKHRPPVLEISTTVAADAAGASPAGDATNVLDQSVDFRVRNTFIEVTSPSLQPSRNRVIHSCPGKRVGLIRSSLAAFDETNGGLPEEDESSPDVVDSKLQAKPLHCQTNLATPQHTIRPGEYPADDVFLVPSTPEAFSLGRCCGSTSYEDNQMSRARAPFMLQQALAPPQAPVVPESRGAGSVLNIICPEWLQNGTQARPAGHFGRPSAPCVTDGRQLYGHAGSTTWNPPRTQAQVQPQPLGPYLPSQQILAHSLAMLQAAPVVWDGRQVIRSAAPCPPAPTKPAPGTIEMPSVGSAGHAIGRCKPCAFLYSKGCEGGAMCKFCHLCEPGEKKRRQKEKKQARKRNAK
eukprot:TRINITY_DN23807_c0_g2_i1.p1 TRINITY_DN23807_c0_g2~~TRINITY_DN23807_c0_g2_i1.p1  ORF type:complete len:420 (+),score=63.29 TRINITY_DN23807_c0_g2_i1:48-1262(+)